MIDWAGDDIVLALSSRPSVVGSWLPNFQGDVSSCDKRSATLNRISVVISNLVPTMARGTRRQVRACSLVDLNCLTSGLIPP